MSKELSSDELQFWGLPLVTEFFEVKKHLPSYEPVALLPASVIHNEKFEVRDFFYSSAMCMLVVATGSGINVKDVFKSIASLGNHQAECATIEIYSVSDGLGDQKNFRLHCKAEPKQPVTCIDFDEKTQLLAAGLEIAAEQVTWSIRAGRDAGCPPVCVNNRAGRQKKIGLPAALFPSYRKRKKPSTFAMPARVEIENLSESCNG